jgi:hypothetical protein
MNRVVSALAVTFLFTFGTMAQTTNGLSEAEIQGRQLAAQILTATPVTNFRQTGVLGVEDSHHKIIDTPVTFDTVVTNGYWQVDYLAEPTNKYSAYFSLTIIHSRTNQYLYSEGQGSPTPIKFYFNEVDLVSTLDRKQTMSPFANSDFWVADLGLEFFHWPDQKILKHETRRTRACAVLESTNPDPAPGAYSRVDTWIDNETLGPVHAEAYDARGKLLKVFDPKSFKKVNGQWELQDMEIRNVQTGSRTWIKFDLK